MKKFDVSIEDENVVLRSSAGEVESIRINGGASFNLVRDNKLVLKIESPVVGANGLPLDHGGSDSQYEKDTDTVPYERKEIPSFASLVTGDTLVTPYTPAAGYMYNSVNLAGCEDSQSARLTEKWVRKHLKRKKKAAKKQEPAVLSSGDALYVSVTTVNGKATGFSQSVERGEGEGKSEPQKICAKKITAMKDERFLVGSEIVRDGAIIRIKSPGDTFIVEVCNEKPKTEAALAKEQERGRKDGGEVAACGNCAYFSLLPYDLGINEESSLCKGTGWRVPCSFVCKEFKSGAEVAEASSKIATEYLSGVAFSTRLAGDKDAAERIAQLEKEKAELQDQNAQLREKLDAAIKDVKSKDGFLVEQLAQAAQRMSNLRRQRKG